ncbi:Asp-tRNA(Asn)/Glu-tRNA(Gln) amidotransferase subunit GatB [Patescibacteria group bacterium]|nr:Asp-tRNA(Asn)/Glu-tRNA(Gln) amidotransferase subunit GatB [Patescibacteria group bacterium]
MLSNSIIGLETHIELKTASKMFCGCSADYFGKKPNSLTCPTCLGLPGALPVPNKKAIEKTIMMGLALNCEISYFSKFDRKNYFYPDLPKGYQISQYDLPFCINGRILINDETIRITRIHLEEDTASLAHKEIDGEKASLIDFNRSGVPLMEIVTEPDFTSASQAKLYLQKLQQIARALKISDADMEKGQMRCEPNINLQIIKDGKKFYTPISEIKNINSFKFTQKAIEFEEKRQLEEFKKQKQEKEEGNKRTVGWDEKMGKTFLQREKEEAKDYRYFPEPDIPPIRLTEKYVEKIRKTLLELPDEKQKRYKDKYGLTAYQAQVLASNRDFYEFFEEAIKSASGTLPAQLIANAIINKKHPVNVSIEEFLEKTAEEQKASSLSEAELAKIIKKVLAGNKKAVSDYKKGKENVIGFLVGQIAKKTGERINPELAIKIIKEKLK